MRRAFLLISAICLALTATAQSGPKLLNDTLPTAVIPESSVNVSNHERFRIKDYIAPAVLIGVGAYGVSNGWLGHVNDDVKKGIGGHRELPADDILQFLPAAVTLLPDAVFPTRRYDWRERVCLTFTAEIINEALLQPIKHIVNCPRPDGTDNHSFPSGHSARAFMGAELLRVSCGTWPGIGGYAVATAVGVMRITSDRHHLTDVIGGAGIGILSVNLARLLLPFERRLFGFDGRRGQSLVVLPTADPKNGSLAMTLAMTL